MAKLGDMPAVQKQANPGIEMEITPGARRGDNLVTRQDDGTGKFIPASLCLGKHQKR
jgi:hypothetical protein